MSSWWSATSSPRRLNTVPSSTMCASISVGIGFFNLLPLPVLDGGHLVFNAYEALTGRHLPEKVQEVSLTFGLILLLGMVVVITWGDVIETGLFGSGSG